MKKIPDKIDGGKVLCATQIDSRHNFTHACRQIVAGKEMGPMAGLAVCKFDDDDGIYLIGCDEKWNGITDTWHQSLDEAIDQAEFEYKGARNTMIYPDGEPNQAP